MKKPLLLALLISACTPASNKNNLTPELLALTAERISASPSLNGESARGVKISPDGKLVTYLKAKKENSKALDLWQYKITSKKHSILVDSSIWKKEENDTKLSEQERALRERKRVRHTGIISYWFSKQSDKILFPIAGDLYIYRLDANLSSQQRLVRITKTKATEFDPKLSPKGNYVSYLRDNSLYIYDLKSKKETQLIKPNQNPQIKYAVAEFVAQEEMQRYTGYWWSKDESRIAYTRIDETDVSEITRVELYSNKTEIIKQKYPRAGETNALVWLGSINLKNKKTKWFHRPKKQDDTYLTRAEWLPEKNSHLLSFQVQSRNQKNLDLMIFNTKNDLTKTILTEKHNTWVNLHNDLYFYTKKNQFIWKSEASGYGHLYLYDLQGKLIKPLTSGEWPVLSLTSVDEATDEIYFISNKNETPSNQLFKVSATKPTKVTPISSPSGKRSITFSKAHNIFIENYSSDLIPPQTSIRDPNGELLTYLYENSLNKGHPAFEYAKNFPRTEYGKIKINGGKNFLFYKMLRPLNFNKNKKYPLIQYVYGGPGVQVVSNSWPNKWSFTQYLLVQNGFIVIMGDNRGSSNRGKVFEDPLYLNFGKVEVDDQSELLKYFLNKRFVDKKRIGVFGHSYGGYLTQMLMLKRPKTYKVGVSGAPVTDWKLYDTHYTERFMGTPSQHPENYKNSDTTQFAKELKGKLLIVHGMADDNVLFDHSIKMYAALQAHGKPFDLMNYPGSKHGIRSSRAVEVHYRNLILNYFKDHL